MHSSQMGDTERVAFSALAGPNKTRPRVHMRPPKFTPSVSPTPTSFLSLSLSCRAPSLVQSGQSRMGRSRIRDTPGPQRQAADELLLPSIITQIPTFYSGQKRCCRANIAKMRALLALLLGSLLPSGRLVLGERIGCAKGIALAAVAGQALDGGFLLGAPAASAAGEPTDSQLVEGLFWPSFAPADVRPISEAATPGPPPFPSAPIPPNLKVGDGQGSKWGRSACGYRTGAPSRRSAAGAGGRCCARVRASRAATSLFASSRGRAHWTTRFCLSTYWPRAPCQRRS